MKTIWEYTFGTESDIQEFDIPSASIPLSVHMQGKNICMWCAVETDNPVVKRKFCIVGTGHEKPEGCRAYIGSVYPEPFVFHIFVYEQ